MLSGFFDDLAAVENTKLNGKAYEQRQQTGHHDIVIYQRSKKKKKEK